MKLSKHSALYYNKTRSDISAINYAKIVSDLGDGMKVHGIYNPTNGIVPDVMGACIGMFGMQRHATTFLAQKCNEFLSLYPDDPQIALLALLACHSDGATHVYNYLKNKKSYIQKRFFVLAIAPATVISRKICFNSYNYTSKRDFVSLLRPALLSSASAAQLIGQMDHEGPLIHTIPSGNLGELHFLKPHRNAKFHDHDFDSPTFSPVKEERLFEYFKINGEI